jgi:hypothetical protein
MGLIEEVAALPEGWNFVLCHEGPEKTKAAYQSGWSKLRQNSATITELLKDPIESRKASMVGVLLGKASGGLLAVDHDGESAGDLLRNKFGIQRLPTTPTITSGKPGRFCSFYSVPAALADSLKHITFKTGTVGPDGKEEALELRWTGQQIIAGIHPETGNPYQWLDHPKQVELAEAPATLLNAMKKQVRQDTPLLEQRPSKQATQQASIADEVPLEKLLARDHRDLIAKGCGEGGRNNAGFKLATDLIGVVAWCKAEGVRYNGHPGQLFLEFCARCSPPLSDREARTIYESAEQKNPGPCLSDDKLRECVRAALGKRDHQGKPQAAAYVPPQPPTVTDNSPFQFLGFNKGVYYYLPRGQKQVISLSASAHIERQLLTLAPRSWWLDTFEKRSRNAEPSVDWGAACSWLYEMQHAQGVYDARRVRGRGCWIDSDRVVIHLGERVICDGAEVEVGKVKSRFIYEQGAALAGPALDDPMPVEESRQILKTAQLCRWEHPASAAMLAGWVALAPVCGALSWRSHAWIVGGAGSGKSTVLSNFVKPLLGEMETSVLGASTEAGLRQHLGSDAIPVLMDEAEQAQARDEERLQAVMELARASSSETGAKTLKGTASGTGQEYLIRSMFLLSSITSSLKQGSDKSRFALLQLRNPANDTPAEQVEHAKAWEQLRRDLSNIDANTGKRLIARTVKRLPALLREVTLFSDACSEYFGSRRAGDQFGALMAGAFSLVSDEEATLETAAAFIGQHHWEEFLEPARDAADHERCLNRILESRVRVSGTDSEIPMGELLEIQLNRVLNAEITSKRASELMQRSGLKVVNGRLIVSANHTAIAKILEKTPWSNDWRTVLKQIPGAEVTGSTYFTGGHQSRGVSLPIGPNARDS